MTSIPLRGRGGTVRAYVLVDDADFELLAGRRWFLDNGYAVRQEGGRKDAQKVYMHREILGLARGDARTVDHISMDRLDNRRANLRVTTFAENMQNRRSQRGSSSKFRGVSFNKAAGRWEAYAETGGVKQSLGLYAKEDEAAAVASNYRAAHMPFAMEAA